MKNTFYFIVILCFFVASATAQNVKIKQVKENGYVLNIIENVQKNELLITTLNNNTHLIDTLLLQKEGWRYDTIFTSENLVSIVYDDALQPSTTHFFKNIDKWECIGLILLPFKFPPIGMITPRKKYDKWSYQFIDAENINAKLTILQGHEMGGELIELEKYNVKLKLNVELKKFEELKRTKVE